MSTRDRINEADTLEIIQRYYDQQNAERNKPGCAETAKDLVDTAKEQLKVLKTMSEWNDCQFKNKGESKKLQGELKKAIAEVNKVLKRV